VDGRDQELEEETGSVLPDAFLSIMAPNKDLAHERIIPIMWALHRM
jgi:hypothetical protein